MALEQQPIELIQTRGLISNLTTPAFLLDTNATLVFFNDAASELLGTRYEEAGPLSAEEWGRRFNPTYTDGSPFPAEERPLGLALSRGLPSHARMCIHSVSHVRHEVEVCAFPITGATGTHGALAIFWLLGHPEGE